MFLKEGLATDQDNQEQLMQLIRYNSNFSEKWITMEDYIKKMKPGQDKIFYILGNSKENCEHSPYMEPFKNSGIQLISFIIKS